MRTLFRTTAGLAALSLLVIALPARAASLTGAQVEAVTALLKSFNTDQSLITQVQNVLAPRPQQPACYTFAANMGPGSTGTAVTDLQNALRGDGITTAVTGVYDAQTALAVTAFQEKHAADILQPLGLARGTGLVGAATRTTLNALYGCAAKSVATRKVASSTPVRFELGVPAHGQFDYNNDAYVGQADVQLLLDVAVGAETCPGAKVCDLDRDGRIVPSDALVLANYIGSVAKPGTLDFNNDLKLDVSDVRELGQVLGSGVACPTGKICDVTGDAVFDKADVESLGDFVGR